MSYQVRRIDPYWWSHPLVPAAIVAGAVLGGLGAASGKTFLAWGGAVLVAAGVLAATKPTVSAVLGTLGVLGGLLQFLVLPNKETYGWSPALKAGSGLLFGAMYMVLMDAFVLAVAILYNFFGALAGGIRLDIEEEVEGE